MHVRSPCRVDDFTHVRFAIASRSVRIKTTEGAEPAGGRRSESGVQTWPHGPDIRARGASAQSVWGGQGAAWKSGAWSLQSVERPRRAEETRAGARPSLLCRTQLHARVRDVERAGESSPASAKRSEVIGLWHSSSITEGWTGSYREHKL